jgi:hypothetical protein
MTEPNDSFAQATGVSPDFYLQNNYFTNDSVSPSDPNDYYRFYTLYGPSTLYAVLNGLSADADLYIYDQNQNIVASSAAGSNTSETINVALQGNQYYYVRVLSYNSANTTNYGLYLYNDYSGATLATARDNGISWGQTSSKYLAYNRISWEEYLDYRDNVDIVKFTMEASGTISLRMKDFTYSGALQATMELLDSSGNVLQTVSGIVGNGLNVDRYSAPAGTYYVRYTQTFGSDPYTLRIVSDYAGDVTGIARDLGNVSGSSRRLYDMVGNDFGLPTYGDAKDLYKFTLDKTSPIDLRLDIDTSAFPAPTFDANLSLAQDANNDGFISPGEVLLSSVNPGDDQISTTLGVGTYYVQVVQNGAYTNYQLDLDSDFDAVASDPQPYNNMSLARSFGALIGETPYLNDGFGISAGDFSDYFKFQMTAAGQISASAFLNSYYSRGTTKPTLSIVRDTNNNQRLDAGETITPFAVGSLTANLLAGTYFLHASGTGEQAAYYVRMVADYAGNTLATAKPLATISGATPPNQTFKDYIEQSFDVSSDVNDFYSFNLSSSYQVTLSTTGVAGEDLALSLIKDVNNNNAIDPGDILTTSNVLNSPTENLSRALTAGKYFVRVQGINGSTNYALTAKFGSGLLVTGNGGNNNLSGDFLNDTLNGLGGNDTLNGFAGNDILNGGADNDTYVFDTDTPLGSDVITDGAGIDTLNFANTTTKGINIQLWNPAAQVVTPGNLTLTLGSGNTIENGFGGSLNDVLTGNTLNNDLRGGAGNDILNGGAGNDKLDGGAGNDTYIFDADGSLGSDVITDGAGIDTLNFANTTTKGINIKLWNPAAQVVTPGNLTLTLGSGNTIENAFGGSLNDVLTGNTLNNDLRGGAGNDILNGGAGNDKLDGGGSNDTFVFQFGQSTSSLMDRIKDFAIGIDKIDLLSQAGAAMAAPVGFSRAANSAAATLTNVINQVFADANGAIAGNQALGVNRAALVQVATAGIAGTYLVINDGTAGFQANNDLLINITGYTGSLPPLGAIAVNSFFV